ASDVPLNVLSEEIGFVDRGGDRTIVADPIDGTTNAVNGLPIYCVALAVGTRRLADVSVGLVRNIPTGDTFFARRGAGAFLNGAPIHTRPFSRESAVVCPQLGKYAKREALGLAAQKYYVRALGATALEMCFVAQGAIDLYYFAPERVRITDIAGATLIVREAGGEVFDASGERLDMDLALGPRSSVVAAGSTEALEMLEVFQ
ncbi:MAG: inositol monophosphatase family protein, partial [Thermoplasmatota archaeon]